VNAWASYDQTAKNARSLSNRFRNSRGRFRRILTEDNDHDDGLPISRSWHGDRHHEVMLANASLHSVPSLFLDRSRHAQREILLPSMGSPFQGGMATPMVVEEGLDYHEGREIMSGFFEKKLHDIEAGSGVVGGSSFLAATSSAMADENSRSAAPLSTVMRAEILDIFAVFFDAVHATSSTRSEREEPPNWFRYHVIDTFNATMPWIQPYLLKRAHQKGPAGIMAKVLLFVDLCLRGISQVYFQNNPLSGLLILIGMYIRSTRVATHGVVALVSGNLAPILLGFDEGLAMSGLFGYNSFLVGLALATFDSQATTAFDYHASVLVASVVFGMFSSIFFVVLGKLLVPYKSPPLTLPFNIAAMMFLLGMANMHRVDMESVRPVALPIYTNDPDMASAMISAQDFLAGTIRGIGQVYLASG